jgi:uncharacterized membrane protein
MLSWVGISLLGAAILGAVNILDKTVIYRYATTPRTLPLLIGIAQTTVGIGILSITRIPNGAEFDMILVALGSGVIWGLGAQIMMRVLFTQEVSRTVPITQSYPIFTAIIAFTFLGETLKLLDWAAIVAVVIGGVLLSTRHDSGYRRIVINRSFFLLMLCSAIQAASHVSGKVAVDELPVLFTHGLRGLSLGLVFLIFNLRTQPWNDVVGFVRKRSPALRFVALNELVISQIGLFFLLWALSVGPVSLVIALSSTRSFFLVIYTVILAFFWKGALGEESSRGAILTKIGSTALIVCGVAAITIS